MSIKFAQRLFLVAGVYGVLVVAPLFFLEKHVGEQNPPPITHSEFYYGFAWVTLAWQLAYIIISRDPVRYRPMIMPGVFGKVGFAATAIILFSQGRLDPSSIVFAATDLAWAGLFMWAFVALGRQQPERAPA